MDLDEKKTRLQIMKMDTNILEYEVKIDERNEDIKRIEAQIEVPIISCRVGYSKRFVYIPHQRIEFPCSLLILKVNNAVKNQRSPTGFCQSGPVF